MVREDPIGKLKSRNSRNLKRKLLCLCRCSRRSAVSRGLKEAASCLGDSVPPLDSDPASAAPSSLKEKIGTWRGVNVSTRQETRIGEIIPAFSGVRGATARVQDRPGASRRVRVGRANL